MGREEQQEEREVLDSIFPDEITDLNSSEYRISMVLDLPSQDSESTPPTLLLNVRYPESYPDEAPMLDITQPPNTPKHPHLDIQEDKARLLDALTPTIEENMGMAMIFTVYSTLKDSAELLITERENAVAAQHEMEVRAAEAEENRKFEGEKVTRESFIKWMSEFKREQEEAKKRAEEEAEAADKKKRGGKMEEKKLTGKQLWEQGIAGKTADEDEEGEDAITDGMRDVKVEG